MPKHQGLYYSVIETQYFTSENLSAELLTKEDHSLSRQQKISKPILRSTFTTTVPNFIRVSVVPITLLFELMHGSMGMVYAKLLVGLLTVIIVVISVYNLEETFGKDLKFIEHI